LDFFTDWCKSEKGAQVSPGSKSGEQTLSGSVRSKVMVVDPQASGRKSLTLMLERCGIEVLLKKDSVQCHLKLMNY